MVSKIVVRDVLTDNEVKILQELYPNAKIVLDKSEKA